MFELNAKFDADSLLYLLSHFECDGHTVHMLTQWHLLPPLASRVKSSLFTHAHPSPFSLAASLPQCHTNHSCYSKKGWTFYRQTSYIWLLYKSAPQPGYSLDSPRKSLKCLRPGPTSGQLNSNLLRKREPE